MDDGSIYSAPFHTHVGGYKMCLGIMDRKAVKELISVYIYIILYMKKGEFDSHLVWPFKGNITVQLINQKEGEENLEKKLVKAGSSIDCVSEGNTAKVGRGLCEFLYIPY